MDSSNCLGTGQLDHWTQNKRWDNPPVPGTIQYIDPKIDFYSQLYTVSSTIDWRTNKEKFAQEFASYLSYANYNTCIENVKIIFITHGFGSGSNEQWMRELRLALAQVDKFNIVATLDWSKGAKHELLRSLDTYMQAAMNCLTVGEWVAEHAKALANAIGERYKIKIWGVGHSLGAHLMGMAGEKSKVFDRITGLDPAGPGFDFGAYGYRSLCPSDAKNMVDVIHTDGGGIVPYYGTLRPMGTIDFYPDFGVQKSVNLYRQASGYYHSLAYIYYIWSITNKGKFETWEILDEGYEPFCIQFPDLLRNEEPIKKSKPTDKRAEMGYYADAELQDAKSGHYYLETNDEEPWAPKKKKIGPILLQDIPVRLQGQGQGCWDVPSDIDVLGKPWKRQFRPTLYEERDMLDKVRTTTVPAKINIPGTENKIKRDHDLIRSTTTSTTAQMPGGRNPTFGGFPGTSLGSR